MKTKILGLVIIILLFSCKEETKTSQREIQQYTIEQFMDNESHDKRQLFKSCR